MDLHEIAEIIAPRPAGMRMRLASVTAIAADGTVTVTISGSAVAVSGVKLAAHVCPEVGAGVWLLTDGVDWIGIATVTPLGPAFCALSRASAQSIADASTVAIDFLSGATVEADTHGMFAPAGTTDQLTVAVPGVYLIEGSVEFAANTTGYREIAIQAAGSFYGYQRVQTLATSVVCRMATQTVVKLAAGDAVKLTVRQTSGGALNVAAVSPYSPRLAATWLRPVT